MERIIDGQCIMESDVLFIGSQEYEKEDSSKQEFLTKIKEVLQMPYIKQKHHEVPRKD